MELSLRETMSRDKRLGTTPTEITVVKKRKLIKKAVLLSVFDDESYFDRIPIETVHHIFSFMSGNNYFRLSCEENVSTNSCILIFSSRERRQPCGHGIEKDGRHYS